MLAHILKVPSDADPLRPVVVFLHNRDSCMHRLSSLAEAVDGDHYLYAFLNGPFPGRGGADSSHDQCRRWREPDEKREIGPDSRAWTLIDSTIDCLPAHVGARPVIIGGFSEGGAFALRFALEQPERFVGVIVLSAAGMITVPDRRQCGPHRRWPPVFVAHGSEDPIMPITRAEICVTRLRALGFACAWHTYPIGHDLSLAEVRDLRRWLHAHWPPARPAADVTGAMDATPAPPQE